MRGVEQLDVQVAGKWAFDNLLEDLSDIIAPIRSRFAPVTVETTNLLNGQTKKKAYYAFPLKQQTLHIQYWRNMLAQRRPQIRRWQGARSAPLRCIGRVHNFGTALDHLSSCTHFA